MPARSLTNFEIQKYYHSELEFNGVYLRNNLSKVNDAAYIINLDEYEPVENYWIALYVNAKSVTYFDSFRVEHILKEIRKFIRNKNITLNIYGKQTCDSIMCRYFCIGLVSC